MRIGSWRILTGPEPIPDITGETFMVMYPIIRTHACALVVRHILKSNVEPYLHTHGFPYLTFMLKGGYVEERADREGNGHHVVEHRRFRFNWIPQTVSHRIRSTFGDTWTLGFHMKWLAKPEHETVMLVGDRRVPVMDFYMENRVRS